MEVITTEIITTEEVTIKVETIKMGETMHRMATVMEIIYLIAETSAAVLEGVEHFLIRLQIG